MVDVVERFATSRDRTILQGLLDFRAAFYNHGVSRGFQWIDGSFVENIEAIRGRPPGDIDVVNFIYLPPGVQSTLIADDSINRAKELFSVDAYYMELGKPVDLAYIRKVVYWYSAWSHRRADGLWKGFIEVSLSPDQDIAALSILKQKETLL